MEDARAGDWQCPNVDCINHTKLVFGRNASCPSCGAVQHAVNPSDWICPNLSCINHKNTVFGSKSFCPKCGAAKPNGKGAGKGVVGKGAQLGKGANGANGANAGDWACPNTACINSSRMVFARNAECPKCGTPKPAGPWACPNSTCINHTRMVFARNTECPKCGSPKPDGGAATGGAAVHVGGMKATGNPGDWQCPNSECINHARMVFAKHDACLQCGSPKPLGGYQAVRAGATALRQSPYGA